MCDDVAVPIAVLTVLIYVARRIKPTTLALVVFEAWRRLPPEHRQQLGLAARRNGPRPSRARGWPARPAGPGPAWPRRSCDAVDSAPSVSSRPRRARPGRSGPAR